MTSMEAVVVLNGVTYTGDKASRTVTPDDETSQTAVDVMASDDPCGPQTDEWIGMHATWDLYPMSLIAVFMDIAEDQDTELSWYSDNGTLPGDE